MGRLRSRPNPLGLAEGMVLVYLGRRVTYVRYLGSWFLEIVDQDGVAVLVPIPGTDRVMKPSVDWVLDELRAGRLVVPGEPTWSAGRLSEFLNMDTAACVARDPKAAWRHAWALAALKAGIARSKAGAGEFIDRDPAPAFGAKPRWRTLVEWMSKLAEDPERRVGNLVSAAGREKGQSQLPETVDRLVARCALEFWTEDGDAWKADVGARVQIEWDAMKAAGVEDVGDAAPSDECVRERINLLQNMTTYAGRHGAHAAQKYYCGKGEPVEVEHAFERVTLDGVNLKHIVTFSDDWPLPVARLKAVFAMCSRTEFVFPGAVFPGPFRPEMSVQALLGVMTPPIFDDPDWLAKVEENPLYDQCYAAISTIHPDNERALLPPSYVPGITNVVSMVELPKIYHSDSKAKHERFHRFLHGVLHRHKGRVLGPWIGRDPRYDPLKDADMGRLQFIRHVEMVRRAWNERAKKSLGWKSPFQLMTETLVARQPRVITPVEIRRELSRTVPDMVLTSNGVVHDEIHYRWADEAVQRALSANVRNVPFAKRLEGTGRVEVTGRVWDGNIDYIEIYDLENNEFHGLWSTDPDYTSWLSRWEHNEFKLLQRKGGAGATTKVDRRRQRGRSLLALEKDMPKMMLGQRSRAAALLDCEEVRRSMGRLGRSPTVHRLLEDHIPTDVAETVRGDLPLPPPQPAPKGGVPASHQPPKRDADHGFAVAPRVNYAGQSGPDPDPQADGPDIPGGADVPDGDHAGRGSDPKLSRWAAAFDDVSDGLDDDHDHDEEQD